MTSNCIQNLKERLALSAWLSTQRSDCTLHENSKMASQLFVRVVVVAWLPLHGVCKKRKIWQCNLTFELWTIQHCQFATFNWFLELCVLIIVKVVGGWVHTVLTLINIVFFVRLHFVRTASGFIGCYSICAKLQSQFATSLKRLIPKAECRVQSAYLNWEPSNATA